MDRTNKPPISGMRLGMDVALEEARAAAARGEVPVGASIIDATGRVVAARGNEVEAMQDAGAHAEMLVLRDAARLLQRKYLADCTLTVTLEPCPMCAGAIAAFRIEKLIFGAYDPKSGAIEHGPRVFAHPTTHHKPEIIGGVRDSECSAILQAFFGQLRDASPQA
jgi:tRNA(Arg) A34 adenosine deaminase TadA